MRKKTNPELAEAIFLAKKHNLNEIARAISVPTRHQARVNVGDLSRMKESAMIVPGKVLSTGKVDRKFKVYAINFSSKAKEMLKKAGCEFKTILHALKENKKLEGVIVR